MAAEDGTAHSFFESGALLVEFYSLFDLLLTSLRVGVADLEELKPNKLRKSIFITTTRTLNLE